jgi:hypothetical protein
MIIRVVRAVPAVVSAAACLSGCATLGVTNTATPRAATTRAATTTAATRATTTVSAAASKLARAEATHEYPSPPPAPQIVTGARTSPVAAIEAFADAYINWDAENVAARLRVLAAQSVGQARSAMALAAAGAATDYQLRQGGIANAGTVEAIAPLRNRADQFVVVTLERTTATNTTAYAGLRPAWHLAIATVVRLSAGQWALNGWQPEN